MGSRYSKTRPPAQPPSETDFTAQTAGSLRGGNRGPVCHTRRGDSYRTHADERTGFVRHLHDPHYPPPCHPHAYFLSTLSCMQQRRSRFPEEEWADTDEEEHETDGSVDTRAVAERCCGDAAALLCYCCGAAVPELWCCCGDAVGAEAFLAARLAKVATYCSFEGPRGKQDRECG